MKLIRLSNEHPDFTRLTAALDAELRARYGIAQSTYAPHNVIIPIDTALVGYVDGEPVACGCFKIVDGDTVEIKRMYVVESLRRHGLGVRLLRALEQWSVELGHACAMLETGKGQPEAIHLYAKCGYAIIDNYGPYIGMDNSVCMKKSGLPAHAVHDPSTGGR